MSASCEVEQAASRPQPTAPEGIRMLRRTACSTAALAAALTLGAATAHAAAPTDPQAAAQQPLAIMHVPQALDRLAKPLADVPVLVADTGLDLTNPDIAPRLYALPAAVPAPNPDLLRSVPDVAAGAPGYDLIGTTHHGRLEPDADPTDPAGYSGQGTAAAGVLGAAWNNGLGGAGVAPNARFVALRTCWDGSDCPQYVQAAAIDWAAARGARVASLSWTSGPVEDSLRAAIARHPELLVVTIPTRDGSGGGDIDGQPPQLCGLGAPNVLCATTSAPDDGLDCGGYGAASVDVAVPTQNGVTTTNGGGFGPTACSTTYAAPAAAGVATILYGIDPTAPAADVKAAIIDGARAVPAWAGRSRSGGVVDAAAAVRLFQQRRGLPAAPPAPASGSAQRVPLPTPTQKGILVAPPTLRISGITHTGASRYLVRFKAITKHASRIRLVLQRQTVGRRIGPACFAQALKSRHRRPCTRWVTESDTTVSARDGVQRVAITRRQRGGGLRAAGTYRVLVSATGASPTPSRTITVRAGVIR
jgi:hypothetical protein